MKCVSFLQFQQSPGPDAADVGLRSVPVALDGVSVLVFSFLILESLCLSWDMRRKGGEGKGLGWVVLRSIRGFVGAISGLYGCEADAVVSLDLGIGG